GRQRPEVPDRGPVRLNPRPGIDVTIDNGGRRSGGTRVGRRWIVGVRIRSRWLRPVAVGAGAVALAAGTALVATAGGYPADRPNLLSGAAWLASAQVGRVTLLDGSAAEVAAEKTVAAPNDKIDVVQQGSTAYVVNRSTGSLRRVDGATFDVGAAVRPIPDAADGLLAFAGPLDLRPGEPVAVSGSPHADRLYLAAGRGVLTICELSRADCTTAIPLGPDATEFGAPVETGGRVFVPDYTTGQVWIVDLRQGRVVNHPQVLLPHTQFQLLTRDWLVFFNDPNSERSGVYLLYCCDHTVR